MLKIIGNRQLSELGVSAGGSVFNSFQCYDNTSTCAVICNNSVACFSSNFIIESPTTTINCGSNFACGYSTINASYDIDILESLHIICHEQASCLKAQINVDSMVEFHLDCIDTESCSQMTVNIVNVQNASIACYALSILTIYKLQQFR